MITKSDDTYWRESNLIKVTQNGEIIKGIYVSTPQDLIAEYGCDYIFDKEFYLETYTFEDEKNFIGKLYVEVLTGIFSLAILDKDQQSIVFLHDQNLKELRIIESKDFIRIVTRDKDINFFVWPNLQVRIETTQADHPRD